MLQWEVVFVPPARIKCTACDGQGHMCEIKCSGCNICLCRVFSAGFALDLRMTTTKHLLKVRLCSPGSQSQHPIPKGTQPPANGPCRAPGWAPGAPCLLWCKAAGGPCLGLEVSKGAAGLGRECPHVPARGWGEFKGAVCPPHSGHP